MNTYECLQDEACEDGIDVIDYTFHSNPIKGLYCDGVVAIREDMTIPEKTCALAEELGHHYTSVGNIIDMDSSSNRKQERQARLWAYNKQIGLKGLVRAYEHGCTASHEIAEYLDVTEEALQECIEFYRDKYGEYKTFEHYIIFFIPHLAVLKKI